MMPHRYDTMSLDALIDELNPQQKHAATTAAQHSLVLAGAGCGKTKTIVARAAYLIEQGVPASQIKFHLYPRAAVKLWHELNWLWVSSQRSTDPLSYFCMYYRRVPQAFG